MMLGLPFSETLPRSKGTQSLPDARTLLAKFGIGANEVGRPTASLSPGERTRAVLALLMIVAFRNDIARLLFC